MTRPLKYTSTTRHEEDNFQMSVIRYFEIVLPDDCIFFHPDNGGKMSPQRGLRLKRMGVLPGLPDLFLLYHGQLLGLELKIKGGRLSDVQEALHPLLEAQGCHVAICRNLEEIYDYLAPHMPLKGGRPR